MQMTKRRNSSWAVSCEEVTSSWC